MSKAKKSAEILEGPTASAALVKQRKLRHDGWTDARRDAFFGVLAQTANVRHACAAAGMTKAGAYRRRGFDPSFRREWREALSEGYAKLELEMLERALIGESRVRGALAEARDDAQAIDLLARYPQRLCDLLYRTHRAEAHAAAAEDDGTTREEAIAEIERRLEALRVHLAREAEADA